MAFPSTVAPRGSMPGKGVAVQAQLETTDPGDELEREADSTADLVLRKIETGSTGAIPPPSGNFRRSVSAYGGSSVALPSRMESQMRSTLGGGDALPNQLRSQMEGAFGQSFSNVHIHTDSAAAEMSRSIGARAFTYGNDIYFNAGQYRPETADGMHLLAHELTHTVQQSGKVAREPDHKANRGYVREFFISNWHWGEFYMYLLISHPSVIKSLGIDLDDELSASSWKEKRGVSFLEEVSKEIVFDIKRKRKLGDDWDTAFGDAIDEFQKQNKSGRFDLAPVFTALIAITQNRRDKEARAKSVQNTHTINEKNKHVAETPQQKVVFDGRYFDNRSQPINKMYRFLKEVYPEGLKYRDDFALIFKNQEIKTAKDLEKTTDAFAEQVDKCLSQLIVKKFFDYIRVNHYPNELWAMSYFLPVFMSEVARHTSKYEAAWVLWNIARDEYENLYSGKMSTPEFLVSAETWTALFFDIMAQVVSLAVGGPLFGKVLSNVVLKNPLARKIIVAAADTAKDFALSASTEAVRKKIRGQEVNVKDLLIEAGMSTMLNKAVGLGVRSLVGANGDAEALTTVLNMARPVPRDDTNDIQIETITFTEDDVITAEDPDAKNRDVIDPGVTEIIKFEEGLVIRAGESDTTDSDEPDKKDPSKPRKTDPQSPETPKTPENGPKGGSGGDGLIPDETDPEGDSPGFDFPDFWDFPDLPGFPWKYTFEVFKGFMETFFGLDELLIKKLFKNVIVYKIIKGTVNTLEPLFRHYALDDRGKGGTDKEAWVNAGGGFVSTLIPTWMSPLAPFVVEVINNGSDMSGLTEAEINNWIPFYFLIEVGKDVYYFVTLEDPSGGERDTSDPFTPKPGLGTGYIPEETDASLVDDRPPMSHDVASSDREDSSQKTSRLIAEYLSFNDQVVEKAKGIVKAGGLDSISMQQLMSVMRSVSGLEDLPEASFSLTSYSFNELYTLSKKIREMSKQEDNRKKKEMYLRVAAFLYGLAATLARSGSGREAMEARADRWNKQADQLSGSTGGR